MENETQELSFGDQQRLSMEERVEALVARQMGQEEDPGEEVKEEVDQDLEDELEAAEDTEDSEEQVPEEPVEDLVEVEWEGQLIEAPKAIAEALMRQADYTQKTQDVASQRKALEVQQGEVKLRADQYAFAESIQPDILKAEQLDSEAERLHQYLKGNIDSLSATDIEKIRMAIEDTRRERDTLVQTVHGKHSEFQQAQEQSRAELLKRGTEVLQQRIPGWGEDGQKAVRDYALSEGYSEAEIADVLDPRHVMTLWKASQYDKLQAGKTAAVSKVSAAPKIQPKSRNPMPEDVKSKLNLRKKLKNQKLSDRAKAKLIQQSLGDRFG